MIIKTYGQKALEIKPIIEKHLNKIIENIKSFTSLAILDNLTIEICDTSSKDCPPQITEGIAGLTWVHLKTIQLNTSIYQYHDNPDKYYSNLLSHEFGHWFAEFSGFNIKDSELRKIWQIIRGDKEASVIIASELFAEDFRLLFGADGSKDFERGNYAQANKIQGLKGLMKVFPSFIEYKKTLTDQRFIYSCEKYSNPNILDEFGLMVTDRHNLFFWDFQTYFFDNNRIWKYDYSLKKWNVIKYL